MTIEQIEQKKQLLAEKVKVSHTDYFESLNQNDIDFISYDTPQLVRNMHNMLITNYARNH